MSLAARLFSLESMLTLFRRAILVALLAMLIGFKLANPPPLQKMDQPQPRLNQAAPIPRGHLAIGQTFVAAQNGLSGIELLAVSDPASSSKAALTLRLLDSNGERVAASSFAPLAHNAPISFNFTPLSNSRGRTYTLVIEGDRNNPTTVWAYTLDGYHRGTQLSINRTNYKFTPEPGDLRFSTTYTELPLDMLRDLGTSFSRLAQNALAIWLILFAPGLLLMDWIGRSDQQPNLFWLNWGMALGLSLSFLPLVWLWATAIGLGLSSSGLLAMYTSIGAVWVWQRRRLWRKVFSAPLSWAKTFQVNQLAHPAAVGFILAVSLIVRLLAIRDLTFPQWVDSSHHFTIARLFDELGRVPESYLPLLPIHHFAYHFGFHVLAVTVHRLTSISLLDTFILIGQVLNALTPLAAYSFVVSLTARRGAGLAAAYFVGLVSLFPGYYLSWGRYTQLTGILLLAPALASVWYLIREATIRQSDCRGLKAFLGKEIFVVSLLAGGLLLTHYPLFIFFGFFALMIGVRGTRCGWRLAALAALFGGLLTAPWLLRLNAQAILPLLKAPTLFAAPPGYNLFPTDYFRSALERGWMGVGVIAAAWGIVRRERAILHTIAWISVTFALLNIGPGTWLVNNNAWAITLFLPGALIFGWGVDQWFSKAIQLLRVRLCWRHQAGGLILLALGAGLLTYAGVQGLRVQVTIANPTTVLATADDAEALNWIAEQTEPEAVFLINGWEWLNGTWAGSDGGSWIWPLTGRRTTLPPNDYVEQRDWWYEVNAFNQRMAKISDAGSPEMLALLQRAGVSHVYIGAKGGNLKPEMFVDNPNYRLLYTNGAAWVFEIK
jgi:hypothetical protein